jgi:malate dehydrogenase
MRKKVTIIGAGNVGFTVAQYLSEKELADIVVVDIAPGLPQGKSLDLFEASPVRGFDARIDGSNDLSDAAGSDLVIITAGLARKPGMSREDLLLKNAEIVRGVTRAVAQNSPESRILVVTNPLDVMTCLSWKTSGFPAHRVMGMAGLLDAARFRSFVALELGVSAKDVQALVLGGHGDSMVPLPRYCTVCGIPLPELLPEPTVERIVERTRKAGGEIVSHLKTGSAFYSPGACAAEMAECMLKDQKRLLPASAHLDGEYGLKDVFVGVPVVLGGNGVERVIELPLADEEKVQLRHSAEIVSKNIARLDLKA